MEELAGCLSRYILLIKKVLSKPTLYLSDFFERNRRDYYDHLNQVRLKNDIQGWIKFFLIGVVETAQKSISTFQRIISLREHIEFDQLPRLGRKQKEAKRLMIEFYQQPILDGVEIAKLLEVHPSTANRLIKDLQELGILTELTGYKRNRNYAFREYIDIF